MAIKQLVTAEELWEMPEKPGVRYELVRGEVIEVPAASALHGLIALLVYKLLDAVASTHDLGVAFADGVGYLLRRRPDVLRVPDASFISWERMPGDEVPEAFWPIAPDLAVEVVSPHDRATDIEEKVEEYLAAGTVLVWVLWPRRRTVDVHTPDGGLRRLGPEEYLDGGDVLPEFRVRVADLFAVRRQRARQ
jgi:Uma2 family endonuclease